MVTEPIAITGASGAVGGRIAARLADRGIATRLIVRDASRAPRLPGAQVTEIAGYDDRDGLHDALRGVRTLMMISARESATRVSQHANVVDAALAAGVERVVYTSSLGAAPDATFTFARDHAATEDLLRGSGLAYTFLRDSLYAELVPMVTSPDGVIAGPAGDGKIAWVARDDVADAATAVLTGTGHDGRGYDLTGPQAHPVSYAAEQLGRYAGRPITYHAETLDEAYAARASSGAPRWEVDGWVTSFLCISTGEMDVVSTAVPDLTGHPALSLPEFLAANPDSYAHLRR